MPDHWHGALLRMLSDRASRCTTNKHNELAPFIGPPCSRRDPM